jgi:hypothetical protein
MLLRLVTAALCAQLSVAAIDFPVNWVDDKCVRIEAPGMGGTEDLVHYKDGVVLVGSGDLGSLILYGQWPGSTFTGSSFKSASGIFALDVKEWPPVAKPVEIEGAPKEIFWNAHGLHFSNVTSRLYVNNHGMSGGGTRVLVLKVVDDVKGAHGVKLVYERSITSDLWGNGQLNDIVEGGDGKSIYASRWLQEPMDDAGPHDGAKTVLAQVTEANGSMGVIFHCKWSTTDSAPADCQVAIEDFGASGPNGMAVNKVTGTIYVSDALVHDLYQLKPTETGKLIDLGNKVHLPSGCDNIELEAESGAIMCGAILDIAPAFAFFAPGTYEENKAKPPAPGGMHLVHPPTADNNAWVVYPGALGLTKLHMVSGVTRFGSRYVLGSPWDRAVVACDLDLPGAKSDGKEL